MDELLRLDRLRRTGVIAVLRAPSADVAVRASEALIAGGVTGIEVTYSTPGAPTAIERLRQAHGDAVHLGAGTIRTAEQAAEAAAAGAQFLVSPGTDPEVARAMLGTGVDVLLGALTPSEVMAAHRLGAHAVKIFPASLGGPAYLKALRGPFPDIAMMPTGGVASDNIADWLDAGAVAVGAGGELCPKAAMLAEDWDEIRAIARKFALAHREAVARG
ncbi:2-dehydro-3-deoxyphosphogluconate aldolase / (4S)-4-hydroxy-2-oxoglutarate aldolase [Saccharopolyspora kobensis]|uniref:2-dehydro-3-deoxyphosphogluconate aldolase / (4S)-4-hydroxy-2-oxoglutarate aldolase n=2 Tax=Saccharopolyspora kobensis TaxID=146035 RepID=A0A1H6A7V6_9PSEU|nr:bifunctional 4-hydroxy-2-oxoglutarate aldolase/2-dehydro-3-deoxy-phosphogluconate aldolase [Saccharopolyspora kobensis]SEG44462.1 2-dehydro-3-deoxyphosphogluconate aldolase / (4S)-4-hydroxy-2-oxoglutarate aldolase [Saccharopolyspora kobensis]SFE51653.1 2-keto-3-deoxy-phosphogluconate aldolase [Saccharopolyspora kobensis]